MGIAYGIGGVLKVPPPVVTGEGAPAASFVGIQGQDYYDTTTTPPTQYTYNGQTWVEVASAAGSVQEVTTDSGTALPVNGVLSIQGANGLSTIATGDIVTVRVDPTVSVPVVFNEVTLTATEVKALATTPITLVAAPAAGATLFFFGAVLKLNYGGSNPFTESGDNLGIKYTDASGVQVCTTIECTNFIDATADTYINAVPAADVLVAATGAEAQALVLDNLGNNFAGNAADDNTLTVRVYYAIQAIA